MKKKCAVTIGFFDGVHCGHRFLLHQLEALADTNGLSAVTVTFDRHPKQVICEDFVPLLLTTQEEKLAHWQINRAEHQQDISQQA